MEIMEHRQGSKWERKSLKCCPKIEQIFHINDLDSILGILDEIIKPI